MRVLVIYGNQDLLLRARPIFEQYDHHFVFLKDEEVDFNNWAELEFDYNIIFSLHCKKIFPKWLIENTKCINIHPGYNPFNRGMFPHVWSIINGLPAGATIHEMDEGIDTGPIIAQREVPVTPYDTSDTLYKRVIEEELSLLTLNLGDILKGDYQTKQPKVKGNYNSLADFKQLCELGQEHEKTINLLRALTHGEYKNARYNGKHLKLSINP